MNDSQLCCHLPQMGEGRVLQLPGRHDPFALLWASLEGRWGTPYARGAPKALTEDCHLEPDEARSEWSPSEECSGGEGCRHMSSTKGSVSGSGLPQGRKCCSWFTKRSSTRQLSGGALLCTGEGHLQLHGSPMTASFCKAPHSLFCRLPFASPAFLRLNRLDDLTSTRLSLDRVHT